MLRPPVLLTILCFIATLLGAKLFINRALEHQLASTTLPQQDEFVQDYVGSLEEELDQLRSDNAALRSLIEKDAPLSIVPELIEFVEKDLGLAFQSPPIAFTKNQDILRDAAAQAWLQAFDEAQLEMLSYSFDVLGISPPDQQWIAQVIAAETVGSRGVYDPSTKEIILAEGFDSENIHHQAALVRLLVINLLDQHFPLSEHPSFDHFLARRAIHWGRASMLQDRFYTLQAKHIGFISEPQSNKQAVELFAKLPTLVRDITTFPNFHGKTYLAKLKQDSQKLTAIKSPVITTQDILTFQPARSRPTSALSGHKVQFSTQLGAFLLKCFLRNSSIEAEQTLLNSFQNDALTIITNDDQYAVTQWSCTFADSGQTDQLIQAAENLQVNQSAHFEINHSPKTFTLTFSEKFESE